MKEYLKDLLANLAPESLIEFHSAIPRDFLVLYEMGSLKFSIFLFSISIFWLTYLIYDFQRLKNGFKYPSFYKSTDKISIILPSILVALSFLVSFVFALNYSENYIFFYNPTTGSNIIYSPLLISFFYVSNIILFYIFCNKIFKSKILSFFSSFIWVFSSFHLMNLFSSPMRDYLKANLFILCFILIYFILESKKPLFKIVFFSSLIFSSSLLFKTDLRMLTPIFILAIFLNENQLLKEKIRSTIFFLSTSLYFVFLSSSVYPGRTFHRLGATLSNDMFPEKDFLNSFGPISDSIMIYQSCISYNCNMLFSYFNYFVLHIDEMLIKYLYSIKKVFLLPFSHGILPEINTAISQIFFLKFNLLRVFVIFDKIYIALSFVLIFLSLYKNKDLKVIFSIILFLYLCFFYSLQFQGRHYFFLEVFSIIFFMFFLNSGVIMFKQIKNKLNNE